MRKFTISIRYLFIFTFILNFSVSVFAQTEKYSVAANWKLYSVADKKVSFMMPRLPVAVAGGDDCRGEILRDYYAYTEGAVYSVRITSKVKPSRYCSEKKEFDEMNFSQRVNQLKRDLVDETNSANNISKSSIIKLSGKEKIVKLINDYENERWFELTVYGADENKNDVKRFLDSLKIENRITGIPVGKGAEQVFGDDVSESIIEQTITDDKGINRTVKRMLIKTDSSETRGITIIAKPRANYTEAARQMQIQGKVVLRVTFQANGAIGEISVISSLPAGLTEEAIKAARKIAFIPPQRDGFRYTVSKPVEYTFTVY